MANLEDIYKQYPFLEPDESDGMELKGIKNQTAFELTMEPDELALHFIEDRANMYKKFMQRERETMLDMDKMIAYAAEASARIDYTKGNGLESIEELASMARTCTQVKRNCMKNIREYGEVIRWLRKQYQTTKSQS